LKEAIKAEVLVQKMRERRRSIDEQIKQHLQKKVKTDIPSSAVERHHKELMDREIYNLQLRGIPESEVDKYKKELGEKLKPIARDDVKLSYILEAIAKTENLKGDNPAEIALGFVLSQATYT
jgi:trigger factor